MYYTGVRTLVIINHHSMTLIHWNWSILRMNQFGWRLQPTAASVSCAFSCILSVSYKSCAYPCTSRFLPINQANVYEYESPATSRVRCWFVDCDGSVSCFVVRYINACWLAPTGSLRPPLHTQCLSYTDTFVSTATQKSKIELPAERIAVRLEQ